ncbi:MAG: putative bifunctional diguanylate cyclase/phosphodiesterase [Huintestinicola sp.]
MENTAFYDGILNFFEQLNEKAHNMDDTVDNINSALQTAAKDIRLARARMSLSIPPSSFEPNGDEKTGEYVFLSEDYAPEGAVERNFTTSLGGTVTISLFPVKGAEWNDREKAAIRNIAKNCYIIGGKARALGLVDKCTYTDRMTGVDNTDGFMRYGGMLTATGRLPEYASVYINIKNFKFVNKQFGSSQGDTVLRRFSQAMSGFVGEDGRFARLGGDNFMILIKKQRLKEFLKYADEITFDMGDGSEMLPYDVKLRLGVYEASDGDTMSDIMNKTSIAYNSARLDEKKDVVFFSPVLLEYALHRKEISTLFPKAVENGEFVVYYQPKIRLSDNKLCGCEALCRWIRNGNIVPPMDFIPVLESEGSICKLDFYVFEAVCADLKQWIELGIEPVRVSVNFSKRHLHNKMLADQILGIIKKYEIDSKYIEVELTEMTSAEDFNAMSIFVDKMKSNGVITSIDDFGTGYSSLNLLKDLNVDVIKLDRSFFTNIDNSYSDVSTDRIVVKNIVNMVNELKMEAISEGVETPTQADFLRETHCSMAQGFLFDRPLPKDEFEKRLRDKEFYKDRG